MLCVTSEEAPFSTAQSAPTIASLPHQYEDVSTTTLNVDQHATGYSQVRDGDSCEAFQT